MPHYEDDPDDVVEFHVSITRYRPTEPSNFISAVDFFISLSLLNKSMTINPEISDISFDAQSFRWCSWVDTPLSFKSPELTDLGSSFIAEFFRCITSRPEYVTLTRCEIPPETNIRGHYACFDGIVSGSSMLNALRSWDGSELHIKECPGFTDAVLRDIGDEDIPCLRRLRALTVTGAAFSAEAFKYMVERRYPAGSSSTQRRWSIWVDDGPALPAEMRNWFEARVPSFIWEP
ncbi:hypothetical protein CONPUDRAFT_76832 [Coniophora puteana RWD-64-598 SS2]|uniref:F-box domain-containing protein n=1 Tax=Coniophora puteana (strain RWD-64-598) TaxID=741705 RepID=A0A5M3MCZ9_CONPW|nr:uncharacterized protein CONPUDRAFT_76832 [Coniophora puteana RWD-64-598 SS2]EIW76505.1 hypothetical protein CONPUDRAFT_76832 [Coniophora puteana RWD-64-598 SS2]